MRKEKGFDHVSVLMPGGAHNLITAEEFLSKSINERIELVLQGRVEFILDGNVIPIKEALGAAKKSGIQS